MQQRFSVWGLSGGHGRMGKVELVNDEETLSEIDRKFGVLPTFYLKSTASR